MGITFRIIGLDRLKKSFRNYRDVRQHDIEDSIFRFAFGTEIDAKKNVPVKTGKLQRSIRYSPKGRSLEKTISANTDYAGRVEFSHRTKPFYLRRAFVRNKALFLKDLRRLFRKPT